MKKLLLILPLFFVVALGMAGREGVGQMDVKKALKDLESKAEQGDTAALFRFARILQDGYGEIAPDTLRALRMYGEAADKGYPPALNYLGFVHYNGLLGLPADRTKGIEMMEKAAMAGDYSAAANLGWLLSRSDTPLVRDTCKAIYWLGKAAESGNPAPMEELADLYMERGDTVTAENYLEKAAFHGGNHAAHRLMEMRRPDLEGKGIDDIMREAIVYYHEGAPMLGLLMMEYIIGRRDVEYEHNLVIAQANAILAQQYSLGTLLPYNYEESMRLFWLSANQGYGPAAFVVSEILELNPDAFNEWRSVDDQRDAQYFSEKAYESGFSDSGAIRFLMP